MRQERHGLQGRVCDCCGKGGKLLYVTPLMPNEEEGEQAQIDEDGPEAEVQQNKTAQDPFLPSAAEVEQHRINHMPYRSWCRECVEGKALGERRQPRSGHESKIPVVGMDYFYMTQQGFSSRGEMSDFSRTPAGDAALQTARVKGDVVKCLVTRCSHTKCIFAHVVPVKGIDEDNHVTQLAVDDIRWLGHTRLIIKADNERSLQRLVREALKTLNVTAEEDGLTQSSQEMPPKYDSQSNGLVEVGVRSVRAQFRTMRACLQRRIGKIIPVAHPVSCWLLEHVCMQITALLRTDDGLTPWIRARGRPFNKSLLGFAESVLYMLPSKGPQHDVGGNMVARWAIGTFLGYSRESNTYIIGTPEGVRNTRAMMRRPFPDRWDAETIGNITTTPWSHGLAHSPGRRTAQIQRIRRTTRGVPRRSSDVAQKVQDHTRRS